MEESAFYVALPPGTSRRRVAQLSARLSRLHRQVCRLEKEIAQFDNAQTVLYLQPYTRSYTQTLLHILQRAARVLNSSL